MKLKERQTQKRAERQTQKRAERQHGSKKDKHKDNQKDTMAHLISTMSSSTPSALCCKLEENRFHSN